MPLVQQAQIRYNEAGEPGGEAEEGKYQFAVQL